MSLPPADDDATRKMTTPSLDDDETIVDEERARRLAAPETVDQERPTVFSDLTPLSPQEVAALPDLDEPPAPTEAPTAAVPTPAAGTATGGGTTGGAATGGTTGGVAAKVKVPLLQPGAMVAERYRIEGTLGVGGMGVVYRATDVTLNIEVALKVLRPEVTQDEEFLSRFRNELKVARQVTHRNVVRIHDIGLDQGIYYMSMDYIEGTSLEALLKEKGKLSAEEAIPLVLQMARALAEAHRQSVVHRDLKPANILIDQNGEAYVSDFGIARSLEAPALTQTGIVLGTPHYLSPEQARGEKVDGRSDLYTLGIIFVEMLSGKLPFPGGTLLEILTQRISGEAASLKDLGVETAPEIVSIIDRCLAKDPEKRYQNPEELIAELEDLSLARKRSNRAKARHAGTIAAGLFGFAVLVILGWQAAQSFFATQTTSDTTTDVAVETGPPAPRHAIAVLPFHLEGDEALDWVSTALAEMLADSLEEDESLRVIDSIRVVQVVEDLGFAGRLRDDEAGQLAEVFEADRLITGEVRALGDQVQLSARLLEAGGGVLAEPGQQQGSMSELFALVGRLDADLRTALDSPVDALSDDAEGPATASPEAMQAYSEGLERISDDDPESAAERFSAAVEADDAFGAAWVRLAATYEALGRESDALRAARQAVRVTEGASSRTAWEARAREAMLRGEPDKARGFLEQLVERYPNDIEAQLQLAEALDLLGEWEAADARLQTIVALDPSEARAWFLLGKSAILSGAVETAVDEYLLQALVRSKKMKDASSEADVYNALGLGHRFLGQLDQAEENLTLAITVNERLGGQTNLAKNYSNRALVYLDSGNYEAAEADLKSAEALHTAVDNRAGIMQLHLIRAVLEEERGRIREALDAYRNGLQISLDLGDERATAEAHLSVGYIYRLLGEIDSALLHQEKALELQRKIESPAGLAAALQEFGAGRIDGGQWTEAGQSFLEALELGRQTENPFVEAVSHAGLGKIALLQGRFSATAQSLAEATAKAQQLGDPRALTEFGMLDARLRLALGDFSAAEQALTQVDEELRKTENILQRAEHHEHLGRLALARGDHATAQRRFNEALDAAGDSASLKTKARIGAARADLLAGRASAAARELRESLNETQRLGHVVLELQAREALAEALLAAGSSAEAEEQLSEALRSAERGGNYARTFRLRALLANTLQARGADRDSEIELGDAQTEIERLRDGLTPEQLQTFEALPEVRDLISAGS